MAMYDYNWKEDRVCAGGCVDTVVPASDEKDEHLRYALLVKRTRRATPYVTALVVRWYASGAITVDETRWEG